MNRLLILVLLSLSATSCVYKDLSSSLHYAYNKDEIGVENIKFQELRDMRTAKSCNYNALYIFQIGHASITEAAKKADINKILLMGESGFWTFPFSKTCVVVYGN